MKIFQGLGISDGIAIGEAKILERETLKVEKKRIKKEDISQELLRFEDNLEKVIKDLDLLIEDFSYSEDNKHILNTHKMILQDPELSKNIVKLIEEQLYSLEEAISQHFTTMVDVFNNMQNEYFAQRSSDLEDVAYKLLSHVMQKHDKSIDSLAHNTILITKNIAPSLVTIAYAKGMSGMCTELGSSNSHSAIIARSLNLPYGVRFINLIQNIKNGQRIILDGNDGKLIVDPDKKTEERYKRLKNKEQEEKNQLELLIDKDTVTQDGFSIKLMSNMEIPEEVDQITKIKSDGIGLFRTEFLFMGHNELPDEEKQYKIYQEIAALMYPKPLIIRTIDVGGDKLSKILNIEHEANPNLGCRGIRISLEHLPIFKKQLRAILRAGVKGNVKVMFPMISTYHEIMEIKKILNICKKELAAEGIEYCKAIKIGAMIEIPSAAITSDCIAEECDFLSIGTNDLVQYTLAVDRDNQSVEKYYLPHHPSIIKLIKMTVENAHAKGKKVAVCGEMASQELYTSLLIGLGVDELSVSPGLLLKIKRKIRNMDFLFAQKRAKEILGKKSYIEVKKILNQ